jgi:hypothetical protein
MENDAQNTPDNTDNAPDSSAQEGREPTKLEVAESLKRLKIAGMGSAPKSEATEAAAPAQEAPTCPEDISSEGLADDWTSFQEAIAPEDDESDSCQCPMCRRLKGNAHRLVGIEVLESGNDLAFMRCMGSKDKYGVPSQYRIELIDQNGCGLGSYLNNICFQKGPLDEHGVNGISEGALLRILEDRMAHIVKLGNPRLEPFAIALEHVRKAIEVLNESGEAQFARRNLLDMVMEAMGGDEEGEDA